MTTALRRLILLVLTGIAALPLLLHYSAPAPLEEVHSEPAPMKIVVEVIGRDFRWHFRYVEPDLDHLDVDHAESIETLHLPVGASVELRFMSEDYIYLCSLPQLGIKQIAVPGLTHSEICKVVEPASYDLIVDPMCSFRFYHDELMGRIVVENDFHPVQFTGID